MSKPINQVAIRTAIKSSPHVFPDWLSVGSSVYFTPKNTHVKVLGWLGDLVSIAHKGETLQVPFSQLSPPCPEEKNHRLDLNSIDRSIYREIATTFLDELSAIKVLPGCEAQLSPLPLLLPASLRHALEKNNITQLYSHQLQALEELQAQKSIALTTPTASGKSLSFIPHAFSLALSKKQTSLFIYPLRALAADQFGKLTALNEALPPSERLFIARCTGDVPLEVRKSYFQGTVAPDIVVVSPDVLHHQLYHTKNAKMLLWQEFLKRLGLVVCDESHSYTSSFGIHFANVLRRLRLALSNVNRPTGKLSWVISTATIANPIELASQLSGLPSESISLINSSGAKQSERTLLIMQPQAAPNFMSASLLRALLSDGLKGLLFANSRRSAKQIFSLINYQSEGKIGNAIELFHGSLTAERRKDIIDKLAQGRVRAFLTTNALEAGVDLPNLDFVILRGSTSLNSFWQRAGRAGRKNPGLIIFIPNAEDHIDYYYANNSDRLFDSVEKIKLQTNYPTILASHLLCAGAEGGIPSQDVAKYFGSGSDRLAAELHRQDKLYWSRQQVLWSKGYPHRDVSLRGINDSIEVVNLDTGEILEETTLDLAHKEVHSGAIYLTTEEGVTLNWRCQSLEPSQKKAFLKQIDSQDLRSNPHVKLHVTPIEQLESFKVVSTAIEDGNLRLSLWWGKIEEKVSGYDELRLLYAPTCRDRACQAFGEPQPAKRRSCHCCHQNLSQGLTSKVIETITFDEPLCVSFEAPILRIEVNLVLATAIADKASQLQENLLARYQTEKDIPRELTDLFKCAPVHLALHSLSHLLTKSIPLLFLASERDVNSLTFKRSPQNGGSAHQIGAYLYDAVKDGCGTTEAIFADWETVVAKSMELAQGCDCGEMGCPRCLHSHGCPESNEALSKLLALWLLEQIKQAKS